MPRNKLKRLKCQSVGCAVLLLLGQAGFAQSGGDDITYAKHVAPILQEKYRVCHQPNSVAPMSLLTYRDVIVARLGRCHLP